ncbi:flagellar filament capping protein FliD [Salsuginibacillus kocurii]|uniref:flagellar filament capping protein FliD n=1 Tax=Salsuginibacillus kocurii TaxID=427078 RepID=UPI00037DC212|nr:flagellar filament capping protein FliD [Salsuginibacillus kocurii]
MDTQMRMAGMVSGMDIDSQVNEIMEAEREPLQDMKADRNEIEIKTEQYREMNTKFAEFDEQLFEGVTRRGNMTSKEVESSNENLVSATANADVDDAAYRIDEVDQLAAAASNVSAGSIYTDDTEANEFDPDEALEDVAQYIDGWDYDEEEFTITTFNENGEEVNETFEIAEGDSLNDLLDDINTSDLGVQAFFDQQSGQISITREDTGIFNEESTDDDGRIEGGTEIQFEEGFMTDGLNLAEENETDAQNAVFTLNGLETERRENSFEHEGVHIDLHDEFEAEDGPVNLSVSTDTDNMVDEIMNFVDGYNELVDSVNGRLNEEYNRDYAPLTDDQRAQLDDGEIEQWEELAESGLLRNDDILSGAVTSMRQTMYSEIDTGDNASYSHLFEIGITTTEDYRQGGRLEVDEAELREAVEEDPEAVYQLFNSDGSDEDGSGQGVAQQLRDQISHTSDQIGERAGNEFSMTNESFTLGQELERENDNIENFERRLQQTEDRYWDQFTQMEQAMMEAQQQQQQMMSQMGGGGMGG